MLLFMIQREFHMFRPPQMSWQHAFHLLYRQFLRELGSLEGPEFTGIYELPFV